MALGAYQINHVWAVTLSSAEATKRLLAFKELKVKGRRCLILDPENQQVKLRLHWMLHGVTDEDIRTALAAFGKVTEVTRERWRVQGVQEKGSTTRTVLLKMKPGMKVEDLPHQIRVAGELAMVVAPGRPMQCLRCRGTGHVRRECKIPRCSKCRRFGHSDAECVRTYAAATGSASTEEVADHLMDVAEAEEAAGKTSRQRLRILRLLTEEAKICPTKKANNRQRHTVKEQKAEGRVMQRADQSRTHRNQGAARSPLLRAAPERRASPAQRNARTPNAGTRRIKRQTLATRSLRRKRRKGDD